MLTGLARCMLASLAGACSPAPTRPLCRPPFQMRLAHGTCSPARQRRTRPPAGHGVGACRRRLGATSAHRPASLTGLGLPPPLVAHCRKGRPRRASTAAPRRSPPRRGRRPRPVPPIHNRAVPVGWRAGWRWLGAGLCTRCFLPPPPTPPSPPPSYTCRATCPLRRAWKSVDAAAFTRRRRIPSVGSSGRLARAVGLSCRRATTTGTSWAFWVWMGTGEGTNCVARQVPKTTSSRG